MIATAEKLDPRINAYRPDIADEALRGQVTAHKYVVSIPATVRESAAPIHAAPRSDTSYETQALFGESLNVFDEAEGWSWVQLEGDDYVGYIPTECLSKNFSPATHRVQVLRTFVYPAPNIKTPPLTFLPMNAQIRVEKEQEKFFELETGGFVYKSHIVTVSHRETDFVTVAEQFVGTPYLWGGRTSLGLDCSALIQSGLIATGVSAPRDSDMQEQQLGEAIDYDKIFSSLQRGDLIFWKGHVGVMVDETRMLHANGYHMKTVIEPLRSAVDRIAEMYGHVTGVKRFK